MPKRGATLSPLIYDITHLQHRLAYDSPSGIDRVDLLFARYFGFDSRRAVTSGHYGRTSIKPTPKTKLTQLVSQVEKRWQENGSVECDDAFNRTVAWILGTLADRAAPAVAPKNLRWHYTTKLLPFYRYAQIRVIDREEIAENSIYLNIAQHSLEHEKFFHWLLDRRDVKPVFFLHDLLPLDYPEFWWPAHEARFQQRINVLFQHAAALITSSGSVQERIRYEYKKRGQRPVPILACPLPSPLERSIAPRHNAELASEPYFVVIGTIEPRKNHMLLLNIWRKFSERTGAVPKLVIIGKRGWQNDQTVAMLDLCPGLRVCVWEVSGLSAEAVRTLLTNSRGLLMPSFAEGYGLPLVEALSLGVPVVASDIPVFREVTKNKALLRDPIDGRAWADVITALADRQSETAAKARELASAFSSTSALKYFEEVDNFLSII